LNSIDLQILKSAINSRNNLLNELFIPITHSIEYAIFLIPILFLAYGIIRKSAILRQKAIFIICSVLLSATLCTIFKHIFDKERPFKTYQFIHNLVNAGSASFPSGHTSDAFVLATAISLAFPNRLVIFSMYFWATLVGYSRIYLGVHYPSDVLAGAILGFCSALFILKVYFKNKFSGNNSND
jgi:membrane-associated phospholipid phosphatase